jgi:hypothetical protein
MVNLESKAIRKMQAEAAEASVKNVREEEARRADVRKTYEMEKEKKELSNLMFDGQTFTSRNEIARQVHASRTPAGDGLEKGPRGGKLFPGGLKKLR